MVKIRARLSDNGTLRIVSGKGKGRAVKGRIDRDRVDRTTEAEIERQRREDDAEGRKVAAAYARRVRRQIGLSQTAFAARIGVSVDTVRNWEQGKRLPAGPAKALLKLIHRTPEMALAALKP